MIILEDLQPYKDYYRKGVILDPENGNTYKCSIWIEKDAPDQLKVRGIHWTACTGLRPGTGLRKTDKNIPEKGNKRALFQFCK